jgi:hypothetical protein
MIAAAASREQFRQQAAAISRQSGVAKGFIY